MTLRFNPPPGWPTPPSGWAPPPDWQPDPSWPPAPAGWQWWVDNATQLQSHPAEDHGPAPLAMPWAGQPVGGKAPDVSAAPVMHAAAVPDGGVTSSAGAGRGKRGRTRWVAAGAMLVVGILAVTAAVMYINRGPSTPTAVAASALDGSSVSISWTPVADGPTIDHYVVVRNGAEIATLPASQTSFIDHDGLSPADTYTYGVVAVSESRRSTPSIQLAVAPMAPSPTRLTAREHSTTSIALSWAPPPSAPAPDQYVVLRNGEQVATIPGSEPTFADSKLIPASTYTYQVLASWASRTSEASEVISVKTDKPSLSAARLSGSWPIRVKMTQSGGGWPKVGKKWDVEWQFTPKCNSGPCGLSAKVQIHDYDTPIKLTLTRKGADYSGSIKVKYSYCVGKQVKDTIAVRVRVTKAGLVDSEWVATGVSGTVRVRTPYTDAGAWYCPTQTHAMSITGTNS